MQIQTRIEALSEKYLEQALDLQNRIFREHFSMDYIRGLQKNPNYVYLLLLRGENVIGLLCYLQAGPEAELVDIAIDEAYRGLGLGRRLMEEMAARLEQTGILEVFLEVRRSNAIAIDMYTKAGYREVGVRRDYYANPCEDAILMKRCCGNS